MSLLMDMAFAALGLLAIAAIAASVRHAVPLVAELRSARRRSPQAEELRLTICDTALPDVEPAPAALRNMYRPRPIARLMRARERAPELA